MFHSGPEYLRKTSNMVLDALMLAVGEGYTGKPLNLADLQRIVEATKESPELDHFYRASFEQLQKLLEDEKVQTSRTNAFGRLVVHPLEPHFEQGDLDRRVIGNFFFFIRSLFGDQTGEFAETAAQVAEELRAGEPRGNWQPFYDDPRMKAIYYTVMARVVKAFRVFETRRDWVMKVMQHDPTSVALSSTVFVEKHFDGEALPFGNREFYLFFNSLIRPLRDLEGEDRALFVQNVGEEPAQVFGDFLLELTRYKPAD
jgi:hypothetical protein